MDFEEKHKQFSDFYHSNISLLNRAGDAYRTLVSSLLSSGYAVQSITYRVKEERECIDKFKRKYLLDLEQEGIDYNIKDHITDLVGIRIVCLYSSDIESIGNLLKQHFNTIDETNKSGILDNTEDQFGYRGLHLDLQLNDVRINLPEYANFKDFRIEAQIRSIIQDAWSVLDHKIKYKKSIPSELKRSINRLAALFEIADNEFLRIKNETDVLRDAALAASHKTEKNDSDTYLNVFNFQEIIENKFPTFKSIPSKTDEFISQINHMHPHLTVADFKNVLNNELPIIDRYHEFQLANNGNFLNPITKIRHALYLYNKDLFNKILFNYQKNGLADWISENLPSNGVDVDIKSSSEKKQNHPPKKSHLSHTKD